MNHKVSRNRERERECVCEIEEVKAYIKKAHKVGGDKLGESDEEIDGEQFQEQPHGLHVCSH